MEAKQVVPDAKRLTAYEMFRERLESEGKNRLKAFDKLYAKLRKDHHQSRARRDAMKQFDFTCDATERKWYKKRHGIDDRGEVDRSAKRLERRFKIALSELPETADAAIELLWISAHPAMSRKSRGIDLAKNGNVLITKEDIEKHGNGVAPSKTAVHMLQHWANEPKEFYKMLTGKKRDIAVAAAAAIADGRSMNGEHLDDTSELDAMLKKWKKTIQDEAA